MRAVVQRVRRASVWVPAPGAAAPTPHGAESGRECIAEIDAGLLALVGVGGDDDLASARQLAEKLLRIRVFQDEEGRMNRSLLETGGSLALVSQFTLFGDLRKGLRPSFGGAAPADEARPLFEALVEETRSAGVTVVTGRFGADMRVELVNDGPVTLLVDTERRF